LVTTGNVSRFELPLGEIAFESVSQLVEQYSSLVMAVGKQQFTDHAGLTDRTLVMPSKASLLFSDGAALELDHADLAFPSLRHIVEQLKQDLGLPPGGSAKAIIYATPSGGGFPAHFDAYANFVLQLTGHKIWYLAPNLFVHDPTEHYDTRQFPYISPELKSYCRDRLPDQKPALAEEVILEPGSSSPGAPTTT
jgi:hypothetical protein